VQAILQVEGSVPLDDVREEVTVEGRVLIEENIECEHSLGGDELVKPNLARGNGRPVPLAKAVLGVRATVSDQSEDHRHLLLEGETFSDHDSLESPPLL
jgi:hypothetical protein